MSVSTIRIGTRGSALALWQARTVAGAIRAMAGAPDIQMVEIKTEGDVITDVPLSQVGGKAFFTKEIEAALLSEQIDLAVHSLKDLATRLPDGLEVGAVMRREDPRDVMISRISDEFEGLPAGARIGTSSLRRRALVARWRSDVELVDLRGNVPTRIGKLDRGDYDAIILAAAGVKRLDMTDRIGSYLSPEVFPPAVSQGAVAIQIRTGDERVQPWIAPLEHTSTRAATDAERGLLRTLEGGCQVPVGALADVEGEDLVLRATVCAVDGSRHVEGTLDGSVEDATDIGVRLAERLLDDGAAEILDEIRVDQGDER